MASTIHINNIPHKVTLVTLPIIHCFYFNINGRSAQCVRLHTDTGHDYGGHFVSITDST